MPCLQRRGERAARHLADDVAVERGRGILDRPANDHVGTRDAAVKGEQAAQPSARTSRPQGDERLTTGEGGLVPADRPADHRLDRRDGRTDVLAVEGIPHLGPQGVACAEAGRHDAERLARRQQRVPQVAEDGHGSDEFVPVLAGVPRPAHDDGLPVELRRRHGHVVVVGRQSHGPDELLAAGALHGDDAVVEVVVLDDHARRGGRGQDRHHRGCVGGVRDDEHLVIGPAVDDQVVDDAALGVAQHRVLGLAVLDPVEVVCEQGVQEGEGARAVHADLAHVRHVEQADRRAHRRVLGDDPGVLDGHVPPAEVGCLGTGSQVPFVQGCLLQGGIGHRCDRSARTVATPAMVANTVLS